MSTIELIEKEQATAIGDFLVGRWLPFQQKTTVGPFVFVDPVGPTVLESGETLDIAPHPHIGLSAMTYLFEGTILHQDSLGTEVELQPGAVGWMTAGKGMVHSERTPNYLRQMRKPLHGLQVWVALPKQQEELEPSFVHVEASELPEWEQQGVQIKLIAGEALGQKSPVPVHSGLFFMELKSTHRVSLTFGAELLGEKALYLRKGHIQHEGHTYMPNQFFVPQGSHLCSFEMEEQSVVYLFGGEPLVEERAMHRNFVHSDPKRIEEAKQAWEDHAFSPAFEEMDCLSNSQ
ncbi:pirin family protein [Sunxiuqinia rutila]|uniref:pirin family protein n=1 Tax=Sunxiuqinia rutila TaxID=1397841 RepID=UPI003D35F38A